MQRIDELVTIRPYERIGTEPGRSFFTWSTEREAEPHVLIPAGLERFKATLAKPVEIFSHSTPLEFQFIEEFIGKRTNIPEATFLLECERERPDSIEKELKAAREFFGGVKGICRETLPEIGSERDILKEQVGRSGEEIRDTAGKAAKILLAWISEGLFAVEERQGEAEHKRELSRMLEEVEFFWERFGRGYPLKELTVRHWLSTLFSEKLETDFVRGQIFGLLYFVELRDRINRLVLGTNDRRVAIEYLIHSVLNDSSVEDDEKRPELLALDARVKGAHKKELMVERYCQIVASEPGIKQTKARSQVLVEFENIISDKTLQRYLKEPSS